MTTLSTEISKHLWALSEALSAEYGFDVALVNAHRVVVFNARVVLDVTYEDVSRSLSASLGRRVPENDPRGSWSLQLVRRSLGQPDAPPIVVTSDIGAAFRNLASQIRSVAPALVGPEILMQRIAHLSLDYTLAMSNQTKRSWAQHAVPLAARIGDYHTVVDFLTWLDGPLTLDERRQLEAARAKIAELRSDSNGDSNRSG